LIWRHKNVALLENTYVIGTGAKKIPAEAGITIFGNKA